MMSADAKGLRRAFVQRLFNGQNRFARCQASTISDTKNVGIDGKSLRPKCGVHHNIGCFATDSGKRLERVAIGRHLTVMIADQYLGQGDDILRLAIEQPDRLNVRF